MLKRYHKLLSLFIFSMLFLNLAWSASPIEGKRVAANEAHSLFIDPSGTVWLWGGGSEKHPERYRPRPILNEGKFVFAGMISSNAFIIRQDESLWGLGRSDRGQLGSIQPFEYFATQPVQVLPDLFPRVRSLNANTDAIFAIKPDGALWAWGETGPNSGDIRRKSRKLMNHVKLVSSFTFHTLALKEDGSLWAWGRNLCGSLGDGTQKDSIKPRKVDLRNLKGRKIVTLANHLGNSYAVTSDGLLWYWGERRVYRSYCVDNLVLRPTLFKAVDNVQDIVLSWFNILILKKDGTVWWMPVENNVRKNKPPEFIMQDVQEIAAGIHHYVVLKKDGTVWTWGRNEDGQLGDGTTTDRNEPKQVVFPK